MRAFHAYRMLNGERVLVGIWGNFTPAIRSVRKKNDEASRTGKGRPYRLQGWDPLDDDWHDFAGNRG